MSGFERIQGDMRVPAGGRAEGTARLPGSKSLTNRALFCAALADGDSTLAGASLADDAFAMIDALRTLGVRIDVSDDPPILTVRGCRGHLPAGQADIHTGPAGTATRFITAMCSLGHGHYRVDGDARMRQRPIAALVDALRQMGAGIGYELSDGCPPLTIRAHGLRGGRVRMGPLVSSQFVSAVLLAAPLAGGDVLLEIDGRSPSRPYIDMTLDVLGDFGVDVLAEAERWIVPAPQRYRAADVEIEPDASAATYAWAAAALTGGRVRVAGLGPASRQGDAGFVAVLERMGCRVTREPGAITVAGPGDGELRGVDVDLNAMPDTVQTLAVVALFAQGPTVIRNVANLRIKETDRIAALERELCRLGARVIAGENGLKIEPPGAGELRGAALDTYEDHRMAMSLALAGLRIPGVVIRRADCVSKSFPGYFASLEALLQRGD